MSPGGSEDPARRGGQQSGVSVECTIVIPCFNHGRFVGEAVASALAQQGVSVRVVVVNDGSDDGQTPDACDACRTLDPERVVVVHQANTGLPGARNAGAAHAAGEFLAFLDADDTIEPTFARTLVGRLREEPAGVSHAYCRERLTELGQDNVWRVPDWDPELLLITNLHPVTCVVRRSAFERVGGFDATMTDGYEDWEFWVRLHSAGMRGVRVPEVLFNWRRHSYETMIADAIARHAALYQQIVDRHPAMFAEHALALAQRCNTMLRRFDCNWLDEDGTPIPLRYLRESTEHWHAARARLPLLEAQAARVPGLERRLAEVEGTAAVAVHRRLHGFVSALPGPLRTVLRGSMGAVARVVKGGGAKGRGDT